MKDDDMAGHVTRVEKMMNTQNLAANLYMGHPESIKLSV
jgi:hypothetical protein